MMRKRAVLIKNDLNENFRKAYSEILDIVNLRGFHKFI